VKIDAAIRKIDQINAFLRQDMYESVDFAQTLAALEKILDENKPKKGTSR
jgi:flagellar biosynthesis/type III secretory pathway ATPase